MLSTQVKNMEDTERAKSNMDQLIKGNSTTSKEADNYFNF